MYSRRLETSAAPHVSIEECSGNLTVRGSSEGEIRILGQGEDEELGVEREGESFSLMLPGNATLACPPRTTLSVEHVLGNLHVENVEGPVTAGTVHGNATLRAVGPVALEETLGNLSAREVAGDLTAHDVKGNGRVGNIGGRVSLDGVAGNLTAEGVEGGLSAPKVRGNARLGPPYVAGKDYQLNVGGNVDVSVPADASLHVVLRARAGTRSRLPELALTTTNGTSEGTLGAGEAIVEADAKGFATLRPSEEADPFDLSGEVDGFGAQIEWQVNEAVARMASRLEESLSRLDSPAIQERVERATERARRKAEQAAERARMRAERAERRWRRASGRPVRAEKAAATDEERLRVLRMVEKGQITPEQASGLLAALEGE